MTRPPLLTALAAIPLMRYLPLARKCGQNSYPPYPPPEVVRAPL